jgi:hypothetical protein
LAQRLKRVDRFGPSGRKKATLHKVEFPRDGNSLIRAR